MGKYIRLLIAVLVVLGLVLLGRDQVAWAQPDGAVQAENQESVSPHSDKDCSKYRTKKDKEKHNCKDKHHGSVVPPDNNIEVCKRGGYSVGGVATLDIKNLKGQACLTAHTSAFASVAPLPAGTGPALSDVIVLELPARGAILKICFAVPPGEEGSIYSTAGGSWEALRTKVKGGVACAEVKKSGDYTLIGR